MATAKQINEAFLTAKNKNNIEVEKATKRNIDRIDDNDVDEIHTNLMKVFNVKSSNDSKYFDVEKFKRLIIKARAEKIERLRKKRRAQEKRQQEQQHNTHQ